MSCRWSPFSVSWSRLILLQGLLSSVSIPYLCDFDLCPSPSISSLFLTRISFPARVFLSEFSPISLCSSASLPTAGDLVVCLEGQSFELQWLSVRISDQQLVVKLEIPVSVCLSDSFVLG